MKILLLDNSSLTPVMGDYRIDSKTGSFAKELHNLDYEVTVYGQKVNEKNTTHTFNLLENDIKVVGLKRKKNMLINYVLLYLRIIPEILKKDFIYIFYPSSYKYVAVLCWIFNKKFGLYIRGEQGLNDKISHWAYKKAHAVFTVTEGFTNFVKYKTHKDNVYSIKPMIAFSNKDIIHNRIYKNEQPFKVLFLGRVVEDKGVSELVKAISQLKEKGYAIELTIVGDGGFIPVINIMIQEFNLEGNVKLTGVIDSTDKIKEFYIKSDIYILPSYHEGFPRTLYEAMIFGTPIITTFVGSISSIMKDGHNCKEIKPKSDESIVDGLEFAMNNYDKMIEFAKNGTNTVQNIVDSKRLSHAEHLNQILKNS